MSVYRSLVDLMLVIIGQIQLICEIEPSEIYGQLPYNKNQNVSYLEVYLLYWELIFGLDELLFVHTQLMVQ